MKKAISFFLVFLGIQMLVSALAGFLLPLLGWTLQHSPYFHVAVIFLSSLTAALVFLALKWATPSVDYLRSRPWLTVFWSVVAALGAIIPSMAFQEMLPELPNLVEEELGQVMEAHGGYFVVCLLVPLVEELVFRGAILRVLLVSSPGRRWTMIAVSAFLFALAHFNPAQMPHAFVIGLLLGWMYCRTDSIVPGVAYHWANNTVAYFLFKLYPDPDVRLIDVLGTQRSVLLAVVFSLFILLPALYQLNLWMRKKD